MFLRSRWKCSRCLEHHLGNRFHKIQSDVFLVLWTSTCWGLGKAHPQCSHIQRRLSLMILWAFKAVSNLHTQLWLGSFFAPGCHYSSAKFPELIKDVHKENWEAVYHDSQLFSLYVIEHENKCASVSWRNHSVSSLCLPPVRRHLHS